LLLQSKFSAGLLAICSSVLLVGCTGAPGQPGGTGASSSAPESGSESSAAADGSTLEDPLQRVTTPGSSGYVGEGVQPLLHQKGTGPQVFTIDRPETANGQIAFYVACSAGDFTVTLGTFYSGACSPEFQSSGSIPIAEGDGPLSVSLDVDSGVEYWILAIPK
jgi:hypothetical protein